MKSVCYILIFLLLVLLFWNFYIKSKENFTCDIEMETNWANCFDRHQKRNDNNLNRVISKTSGIRSDNKRNKILNDLITDQRNSETSINGILKVAKGDNIEKDPKACEKYPDSC